MLDAFPFSASDLCPLLKPKGWRVFEWELCPHPISEVESALCGIEPKFKVHRTELNTLKHLCNYIIENTMEAAPYFILKD
jgi:hypothetical protein